MISSYISLNIKGETMLVTQRSWLFSCLLWFDRRHRLCLLGVLTDSVHAVGSLSQLLLLLSEWFLDFVVSNYLCCTRMWVKAALCVMLGKINLT